MLAADGSTVLAATHGLAGYGAVYTLAPGSDTPVRVLLARSDERHLVQARRPVALEPLLREFCASTATARVPIEIRPTPAAQAPVLGDPEQLERMVRNILDNAIRHARNRVTPSIYAAVPDTVAIEIADDGPGIPAQERERVFDRFVRLDTSRERDSGTSGLALAKEIATAHGGSITIADAPGGGAPVRIVPPPAAG